MRRYVTLCSFVKAKAFTAVTYAKRTTMNIASIINRLVLRVTRRYSFSCRAG